ncbi:MAG TPA: DEAD/DEAH box helicase [Burkholderiales bacterium]|nr:DEAD/DEAH box helicase [Burkholderiales bacterium]
MSLENFHPAVAAWFRGAFTAPTEAQLQAWPAIQSGRHALIAAPTGSGKTLAAFLAAIDELIRRGVAAGLTDETSVVYVSPLKALSNDIRINLEAPLAGIRAALEKLNLPDVEIRTVVRTGDTPQSERDRMRRRPPHIVVTTPESLYILLGSDSGRKMLSTTRTVIVDEIHAIAASKRGSHLALSLERLEALTGPGLVRVGLSATQKPIEEVARFLVGDSSTTGGDNNEEPLSLEGRGVGERVMVQINTAFTLSPALSPQGRGSIRDYPRACEETDTLKGKERINCVIVDTGHIRQRDLAIELPAAPLEAVMSNEVWEQVYDRLANLIDEHNTTLIFVNTRRLVERASRHLSERLGETAVAAHHGSLAKEQRLDAEQRLKRGELKALVATASLELGIDIGDVDLVCQIASPRSIAAFLQRVGRSGHAVGATPKGRLFPLSRDDLVESIALLDSVRRGELDALVIPQKPLDVLAQQIVAEVACNEWNEDELFQLVRRAHSFRDLTREEYTSVVQMLADGFTTQRGPRGAYLHRDAVNRMLRGRRNARLTAITSGGTIPDTADFDVVLEPQSQFVGTVNEDFAVESLAGDVFQLGNHSYRILRVERGRVRVEDAHGAAPTIPFWLGESFGRTDELSFAVSRLRDEVSAQLESSSESTLQWLINEVGVTHPAAQQLTDYLSLAKTALGLLPTQHDLIMERFFDESGGTQLVIHSPFGSRLNRAWGLALRKRFCRKFNFELQAAATEDSIIISLSTSHSFPLEEVARYLSSNSVREVLIQAMLDAPMFTARWRWNATTSLALPRFQGGKKVPPQFTRMNAEDLIASVFPDQLACAENLTGEREVPDHPLVNQTIHDCLHEAMDLNGLIRLLTALEQGDIRIIARDVTEPSPLALEVLSARPYAYLDDAPLEERRTQAVMSRRWLDAESASDLGKLDADAIAGVREEAWPEARNADELHEALMGVGFLTEAEAQAQEGWEQLLEELAEQKRATKLDPASPSGGRLPPLQARSYNPIDSCAAPDLWIPAERLPQFLVIYPSAQHLPPIEAPEEFASRPWSREEAVVEIVRSRLTGLGPVHTQEIANSLSLPLFEIDVALLTLETEGFAMRGQFTPGDSEIEWCERRLLARIHRYTVKRLRQEIQPVEPRDFMRFLFEWQHVAPDAQSEGPDAVAAILTQLEGFEAPAAAWEAEILPARVKDYEFTWLDDLCLAGRIVWSRLSQPAGGKERIAGPVRTTPIALLQRRNVGLWTALESRMTTSAPPLSSRARIVANYMKEHGASFFDELLEGVGFLRTQLEEALAELVALGLVNADSFGGLRALLVPSDKRPTAHGRRGRRGSLFDVADAGRWALVRRKAIDDTNPKAVEKVNPETLEHIARTLLKRYGVVFWRMLEREADWLPPWRDLLRVFHRLEARGEIRGGRFVAGLSGEQFALPEAVGLLRNVRRKEHTGQMICLSGADPLNLMGSVIAGPKTPALTGSRMLFRDGAPIATLIGGDVIILEKMEPAAEWSARNMLLRGRATEASVAP